MAGHPGRNLSVSCAVSRSENATCEKSQRSSPTAIRSATLLIAKVASPLSKDMRRHHDAFLEEAAVVLRKVENRGAVETAHRIRQRMSAVLVYAMAAGAADKDPAAKAPKPIVD
jgi:hypothetical protein